MSGATYWVRYRVEDDQGYRVKTGQASTLLGLAGQIAELLNHGWEVIEVGATSPRPLDRKERQVVSTLTGGRIFEEDPDGGAAA